MGNIVLVGMPGCGKSTVGVLLAKALGMHFVDTDVVFQAREGKKLQHIIDEIGIDAFLKKEEETILSFDWSNTVIATGGSVIYGDRAMKHLHEAGLVVYIRLPYAEIVLDAAGFEIEKTVAAIARRVEAVSGVSYGG